jgi:hypothetical protein
MFSISKPVQVNLMFEGKDRAYPSVALSSAYIYMVLPTSIKLECSDLSEINTSAYLVQL